MKTSCMIKSNSKGISLLLDSEVEFEALVYDICELFAKSKKFFNKDNVVLSLEGRSLTAKETLVIIEAIELNSNVKISYILDNSQIKEAKTIGALDRFFFEKIDENAKIIKRPVRQKETVKSDTGILILGDVKKDATVIAAGSVFVMGTVHGNIRAGEPDLSSACIVAENFASKTATIGGVTKDINVRYRGFKTAKQLREPVVVRLLHGVFHAEPLSSGLITQSE